MGGSARWLALGGATLCALALSAVSAPQGWAAARTASVAVPAAGTPALLCRLGRPSRSGSWCSVARPCTRRAASPDGQGGVTYRRDNVFSFGARAPYKVTSWAPTVNGTVNSIALTSDCSHAYIGGSFSRVDGSAASNIADIRTYDNTMVQGWAHHANAQVDTVLRTPNGHLLAGGAFTSVNGSNRRST